MDFILLSWCASWQAIVAKGAGVIAIFKPAGV
jgi:hypothetical protein